MKTLVCRFERDLAPYQSPTRKNNKPYHYTYDGTAKVKRGDFAVICRSDSLDDINDFGICIVDEVLDGATPEAKKPVICILDLTEHRERLLRNKERLAIFTQLLALEKQQSELDRFKRLAEVNPEAAALLKQLQAL
jgi:hypothetical protein